MAGGIVLFGATGYTGRLAAESMVRRGLAPVLAARSADKLETLAKELGGLETAVADVSDPPSVTALVERGDVLVSTVGPFVRFGHPAAAAAVSKGAHYLDSTGEPPFVREVFERYGPVAAKADSGMLTAFGYDYVPGNLAGALALEQAGDRAVRVDTGYFMTGTATADAMSGGTRASLMGVMSAPGFAWRGGRIRSERAATRLRSFTVEGRDRQAISFAATDHFGLPRVAPQLREVNAYLGWFGPASRAIQGISLLSAPVMKLPGVERLWDTASSRLVKGSTGGPGPESRAKSGSHIVGIAYDAEGRELAEVHLSGANGYDFTGDILAWGADRAGAGALKGTGALGPVDGFGLEELRAGCAESGLTVVGEDRPAGERRDTGKAGATA
jgi:short subunit dehydrogenase-like uncharacterized protein